MRNSIKEHLKTKTIARIPLGNMNLCQNVQNIEQAKLIHNKETNTYLNYRQLLRHPKYKESWAKSAANEFEQLAQGLKDSKVKGINTIKSSSKIKSQTTE